MKKQLNYKYTRLTYRHTNTGDPHLGGTWKEDITQKKAISLMANYLHRNRASPYSLQYFGWQLISEMQSAYIGSLTFSEAWITKMDDSLTEDEALELKRMIIEKFNKRRNK